MKIPLLVRELHVFKPRDMIAGHPALDFVNTVTGWQRAPRDWLANPHALIDWGLGVGVVTKKQAQQIASTFEADPATGEATLAAAVEVREALFLVLHAVKAAQLPPKRCIEIIEKAWKNATTRARLSWHKTGGLVLGTDAVVDRVVLEFVAIGATLRSPRLRQCEGDDCGWFFIDTSKAGRRRWCDMATCGNAAKYLRYRRS